MTLVDVLMGAALTASLGAGVVMLTAPADAIVRVEQDAIDAQQRLRVIADALTGSVVAAADVVLVDGGVMVMMRDAWGAERGGRTFLFRPDAHPVMVLEGASTMPLVDRIADLRIEMVDQAAQRVRVTAAIEAPATAGRPVPARVVTFEAAPRRGRW
jgi:hypothetical protein